MLEEEERVERERNAKEFTYFTVQEAIKHRHEETLEKRVEKERLHHFKDAFTVK